MLLEEALLCLDLILIWGMGSMRDAEYGYSVEENKYLLRKYLPQVAPFKVCFALNVREQCCLRPE